MVRTFGRIQSGLAALAAVVLLAIGMLACNTEQPPRTQVNDAQITTQVKSKLASDVGASTVTNIDVNTTNGVVTLAGQVESADIKHHVETVASSVPGVVRVNNELQVDSTAASTSH